MGHNGPTFAIDWHPEERNWVASAGRDKLVKVLPSSYLYFCAAFSCAIPENIPTPWKAIGNSKWVGDLESQNLERKV